VFLAARARGASWDANARGEDFGLWSLVSVGFGDIDLMLLSP